MSKLSYDQQWEDVPAMGGGIYHKHVTAFVHEGANIAEGCVISAQARVAENCALGYDVVIGPRTAIRMNVDLRQGVYVGSFCYVDHRAVVHKHVAIAPNSVIAPYQVVKYDTLAISGAEHEVTFSDSGIRIGCQGPWWPEDWREVTTDFLNEHGAEKDLDLIMMACDIWEMYFEYI
jgi:NDP-sugar pyrophosphorylase family protein